MGRRLWASSSVPAALALCESSIKKGRSDFAGRAVGHLTLSSAWSLRRAVSSHCSRPRRLRTQGAKGGGLRALVGRGSERKGDGEGGDFPGRCRGNRMHADHNGAATGSDREPCFKKNPLSREREAGHGAASVKTVLP